VLRSVGISAIRRTGRKDDTYTLRPGESSVYNFSMVFDDPPAPAERDELGLETCDVAARRLQKKRDVSERNWLLDLMREVAENVKTFSKGTHVPDLCTRRFGDCCC
jgi:hypothetical protein